MRSPRRARSRPSSCGVRAIRAPAQAAPPRARRRDGPQVDLGLAGSGHPVEQEHAPAVHTRPPGRQRPAWSPVRAAARRGRGGPPMPGRSAPRARSRGRGPASRHAPQRSEGGARPAAQPAAVRAPPAAASDAATPPAGPLGRRCARPRAGHQPLGRPPRGVPSTQTLRARGAARRPRRGQHQAQAARPGERGSSAPSRARDRGGPAPRAACSTTPARAAAGPRASPRPGPPPRPARAAAERARHERAGHRGVVQVGGNRIVQDPVEGARLDQGDHLRGGGGHRDPVRRWRPGGRRPHGRRRCSPR